MPHSCSQITRNSPPNIPANASGLEAAAPLFVVLVVKKHFLHLTKKHVVVFQGLVVLMNGIKVPSSNALNIYCDKPSGLLRKFNAIRNFGEALAVKSSVPRVLKVKRICFYLCRKHSANEHRQIRFSPIDLVPDLCLSVF